MLGKTSSVSSRNAFCWACRPAGLVAVILNLLPIHKKLCVALNYQTYRWNGRSTHYTKKAAENYVRYDNIVQRPIKKYVAIPSSTISNLNIIESFKQACDLNKLIERVGILYTKTFRWNPLPFLASSVHQKSKKASEKLLDKLLFRKENITQCSESGDTQNFNGQTANETQGLIATIPFISETIYLSISSGMKLPLAQKRQYRLS